MPTPVAGGVAGQLGGRLIYAGGATSITGMKHWLRNVAACGLTYGSGLPSDATLEQFEHGIEHTFVRPGDLSISSGVPMQTDRLPVPSAIDRGSGIVTCAADHGLLVDVLMDTRRRLGDLRAAAKAEA